MLLKKMNLVSITLIMMMGVKAHAVLDLHAKEALDIYAQPSPTAQVIGNMGPGDRLVVSPVIYGEFRKVMLRSGTVGSGYILISQIKESIIKERFSTGDEDVYHNKMSAGIMMYYSDNHIKKVTFNNQSGLQYNVNNIHGTSPSNGFFLDTPFNQYFSARIFYLARSFRGSALTDSTNKDLGKDVEVTGEQKYQSFGFLAKYYGDQSSNFWYGLGIEFLQQQSSSFTVPNNVRMDVAIETPSSLPSLKLALGVDFHPFDKGTFKKLYLLTELHYQETTDTDVKLRIIDGVLGLSWRF